jgi:hypothetical protein
MSMLMSILDFGIYMSMFMSIPGLGIHEHVHEHTGFWYICEHVHEHTGFWYIYEHAHEHTGFWYIYERTRCFLSSEIFTQHFILTLEACFAWPFVEQKDAGYAARLNIVPGLHENCFPPVPLKIDRRTSETEDQSATSVYS